LSLCGKGGALLFSRKMGEEGNGAEEIKDTTLVLQQRGVQISSSKEEALSFVS